MRLFLNERRRKAALCLAPFVAMLLVLASCTTTPPKPVAVPIPVALDELPGFAADALDDLRVALDQQCAMTRPPGEWAALCASLPLAGQPLGAPQPLLGEWLRHRFKALELIDPEAPAGLITGYYEPLVTGSLVKDWSGQVPLRGRPSDLLTIDLAEIEPRLKGMRLRGRIVGQRVVPYFSREEMAGVERRPAGQGKPAPASAPVIAWADNPVDAFFLEIQGSGRVQLRDGSLMRIGYADQNGHPYRAIGKTLIDRGALKREDVNAPAIRQWLQENPASAEGVMQTNPSLVFFRQLPPPADPKLGPPGALGVPLTPLRSIAVDRTQIPLGSMVFVQTTHPVTGQPLNRLMVAQDTGGAIRGVKRADIFWGFGADAAQAAGLMKATARMWGLQPR